MNQHETLQTVEYSTPEGLLVRRHTRRTFRGPPPIEIVNQIPMGRQQHFDLFYPIREQANRAYFKFRHWPMRFIEALDDAFDRYLNDIIATEVYLEGQSKPVAGMLFILAPYSVVDEKKVAQGDLVADFYGLDNKTFRESTERQPSGALPAPPNGLPETDILNIKLPIRKPILKRYGQFVPSVMDVELSAFWVDRKLPVHLYQAAWMECYLQTLLTVFAIPRNPYSVALHEYSDRVTETRYRRLNMGPLLQYERNGVAINLDPKKTIPSIPAYGVEWRPFIGYGVAGILLGDRLNSGAEFSALNKSRLPQRSKQVNVPAWFGDQNEELDNIRTDGESVLQNDHLSHILFQASHDLLQHRQAVEELKSSTSPLESEEASWATQALKRQESLVLEIRRRIPLWVRHPVREIRATIADYGRPSSLFDFDFAFDEILLPTLFDEDRFVRNTALYAFRFGIYRPEVLKKIDRLYPNREMAKEKALQILEQEGGIPQTEIQPLVHKLALYLAGTDEESHNHYSRTDDGELNDILARLREKPIDVLRHWIFLAALDPVPFEQRVGNLEPWPG